MSFWLRIADRLILENTRHPIDPENRQRQVVPSRFGQLEFWTWSEPAASGDRANLFALKFPGTGGRAERGGPHPCDVLSPGDFEVWTINPPGYGGSDGVASLANMVETAETGWRTVHDRADDRPVLVVGNSLGCLYALYVAARYPVAGVFLRNPVPLTQLIMARYAWWNLWLGARMICRQVPAEMDAIDNAQHAVAPLMFVRSERDRLVPHKLQKLIWDAYAGPKREFVIHDADHHDPLDEGQFESYRQALIEFKSMLAETTLPATDRETNKN